MFRLKLLVVLLAVAASGCGKFRDSGCFGASGSVEGYGNYEVMWRRGPSGVELLHVLLIPINSGVGGSVAGGAYGNVPTSDGISSFPEGLFLDGKNVSASSPHRVFVFHRDRTIEGVSLNADELKVFAPNAVNHLASTSVWKDKILPVVDRKADAREPTQE